MCCLRAEKHNKPNMARADTAASYYDCVIDKQNRDYLTDVGYH